MSKEEKEFKARIVELGCVVEITDSNGNRLCGSPACLHHPKGAKFETGVGMKSDWELLIPLCPWHHQWGGFGEAFHAGKITWERKFGTQESLIRRRDELLGIMGK